MFSQEKQGCIHGYRSRVWVGRGSDKKNYLSDWAVTQKSSVKAKKKLTANDGRTDQPTDRTNNGS